jgi:GT2 family glycosyltransferase
MGDPTVWFATGKILSAADPTQIDGAFDVLSRAACPWRFGNGLADGPEFDQPGRIWLAPATAALYRRELFDRVGLLDETFESYLEDVDFSIRCACRGLAGVYVPRAISRHHGGATLGRWHPDTVRRIARNQVFLVAKHYSPATILRCGWHILVGQTLWGLVAMRHGGTAAFVRGKIEGIRRAPSIRSRPGSEPCAPEQLGKILQDGERNLRALQSRIGFKRYWKLYFLLTPGGVI